MGNKSITTLCTGHAQDLYENKTISTGLFHYYRLDCGEKNKYTILICYLMTRFHHQVAYVLKET